MPRLTIVHKNYYHALIGIIAVLFLYNGYLSIVPRNIAGVLPLLIQGVLLFLLLSKSAHAQIAIKVWAIIFIIVAQGLRIVGASLTALAKYLDGEGETLGILFSIGTYVSLIFLTIGIIILLLNNRFATLEKEN